MGVSDFVQRRKLIRVAIFRPDHFLPREVYTKCDYCDSNVVNMLSVCNLNASTIMSWYFENASSVYVSFPEPNVLSLFKLECDA
jgi:hypothetical protein